jgi:hypothetical protein
MGKPILTGCSASVDRLFSQYSRGRKRLLKTALEPRALAADRAAAR